MPRKTDEWLGVAAAREEIRHAVDDERVASKAERRKTRPDHVLATAIVRGDRTTRDQFACKVEDRRGRGRHRVMVAKAISAPSGTALQGRRARERRLRSPPK
jgi:hypothetical protein